MGVRSSLFRSWMGLNKTYIAENICKDWSEMLYKYNGRSGETSEQTCKITY